MLVAGTALADGPVRLRFTVWDGDESLKILRGLVKKFESENPGITVSLENFDYALYHQKMLTQYAADSAPDVAMMDPQHFMALAKRKAIIPLNSLYESDPNFKIDDYYKEIVDVHSDGKELFVMPRDIAPMSMIYYNKRLFKEAGIPYPDGSWTWDFDVRPELKEKDFFWVMRQLTKIGEGNKIKQFGYAPAWPQLFTDCLMYSSGQRYVDDQKAPRRLNYNRPEVKKVFDFVVDLMNEKRWTPSALEVSSVLMSTTQQLFTQQKIAMFQSGIWEVPNMRKALKPGSKEFFDWDICLFPKFKDGTLATPSGGSGYSIFSSTKHKDAAWKLVKFMAGEPGMRAMAQAGIAQPAIKSLALSDCWIPNQSTPLEQQWPANRIATHNAVPFVIFNPPADYWPEVQSQIDGRVNNVYNDVMPVSEAMSQAQRDGTQRLSMLLREEDLPSFNWFYGLLVGLALTLTVLGIVYWPERKVKYTLRERRESISGYKFAMPFLIGFLVFTLGPMMLSLVMSFLRWDMIIPAQLRGFGNYREALMEDPRFWISIKVTLLYSIISVPLGILAALGLALLLNQKVRGVSIFRAIYYLPSIGSAVAGALIMRKVFSPDGGLLNAVIYHPIVEKFTHLGTTMSHWVGKPNDQINWLGSEKTAMFAVVIMSLWGIGGSMVILLAGLQGVPQFYYEAATMDGASPWQKLRLITFPMLTPSLFFCLITGVIGAFQMFTQVFVLFNNTGGPNDSVLVYMIPLYNAAFMSLRMGYASALAWILFFIILFATFVNFRLNKLVYYEADTK